MAKYCAHAVAKASRWLDIGSFPEAKSNFTKALRCTDDELGLFSGTSKEHDRKYVFATVQTMSRPEILAQFSKDDFDYILIDEVHHAAADSYKRIIDYFTPDFMLGMTQRRNVLMVRIFVTCSRHLTASRSEGGFLLKAPSGVSVYRLFPCAPRFS